MYTSVVLDADSVQRLEDELRAVIPASWSIICHHMTINLGVFDFGPAKLAGFNLSDEVQLTVTSFASDDKVMAVGVDCVVPSSNKIKHITVAIDRANGGKPFQSNLLETWTAIANFSLSGHIEECE